MRFKLIAKSMSRESLGFSSPSCKSDRLTLPVSFPLAQAFTPAIRARLRNDKLASLPYKENIPRPSADVCAVRVIHLCAIAELVTILVGSSRLSIVEAGRIDS